jgi:threonine dehydratase
LKPENLQPLGSFKARCGANALAAFSAEDLKAGVATGSAGNFGQGLALAARKRGVALAVHVPESAAEVKLASLRALGATVIRHSFADWWAILASRETGADDGVFVHPVAEADVILGNGTIGLELAEDWPELDTVVVPFGGGGLIAGIALALRAAGKKVRIVACEVDTSIPLTACFRAGEPVVVERGASFIDGMGSTRVLDEMWPLLRDLVSDVVVVPTQSVRGAVRELALRNHLIAEGAGAAPLAAALSDRCGGKNVAVIVSGGNLDSRHLCEILSQG